MESKHKVDGAHGTHYLSWWGMPLHCLLNRGRRGGGLCMPPRSTPDVQAMMTVSTLTLYGVSTVSSVSTEYSWNWRLICWAIEDYCRRNQMQDARLVWRMEL